MLEILQDKKYFTIGNLSKITSIPAYSIRHWEAKFKFLTPARTQNGHRRYTKEHIEKLLLIKDLIYKQKMTLEGVKKYFSRKNKSVLSTKSANEQETLKNLQQIHKELSRILKEW